MTPRWLPILTVLLAIGLVVTSLGWALAGRTGSGTPIPCYSLGNGTLTVSPVHSALAGKVMFTVEESDTKVVLGYFEDDAAGASSSSSGEAFDSELDYVLTRPLGNRQVVDPSGAPIKAC